MKMSPGYDVLTKKTTTKTSTLTKHCEHVNGGECRNDLHVVGTDMLTMTKTRRVTNTSMTTTEVLGPQHVTDLQAMATANHEISASCEKNTTI